MQQSVASERNRNEHLGKEWGWFIGLFAFLALYALLGAFDQSTEITPSHDRVLNACFLVAGLGGLVTAGLVLRYGVGLALWKRVYAAVLAALFCALLVFLMSSRVTTLVDNAIDFPAGRTQTKRGLLVISRAYRTHGKGQSWNIQTTPIWSNLDITRADYEFMLAHQPPDGIGRDGDEVHSHGYFCANVLAQISGSAIRVMHAGSQKLPQGTVIVCPARL